MTPELIPVAELREAVVRILENHGVPAGDAEIVADATIDADLDGRPSHGVARVPIYVDKLEHGGIEAAARTEIVHEAGSAVVFDGNAGFGQVALTVAMGAALERSRRNGIACAAIRNTNNPGMLASYGRSAAADGQIGIVTCNATPAMPLPGGATAQLGTNPVCIALPSQARAEPVLDMATSVAAKGAIRDLGRQGLPIPEGWAVDSLGQPTTDPAAALDGLLLPAGGAKGAGLALMIDLLAGLLSGGAVGGEIRGLHDPGPSDIAALIITIDPRAFGQGDNFQRRLVARLAGIRTGPAAPDVTEVLVPGDRGWRNRQRALVAGVPVPAKVWAGIRELAGRPPAG